MLEREPMVREAISSAFEELEAEQPRREAELSRIDAEAKRVGEEGTMPEAACAPRIEELSRKTHGLKARREELGAETPEEHEPLSDEDLELLVAHVREVIAGGDPPTRKALLQSLVEEIRVVRRGDLPVLFFCPRFDHRKGQCPGQDSNLRPAA